jgi:hypothetical protein
MFVERARALEPAPTNAEATTLARGAPSPRTAGFLTF